jgi:hypothetical protein
MTAIEYFNLNWLTHACTAPRKPGRRFYYDTRAAAFLSAEQPAEGLPLSFYNMVDIELGGPQKAELRLRLDLDVEDRFGLIELPRFKEQEKKTIQWNFLRPYDGHQYANAYHKAVEYQTDDDGFILDEVMRDAESDPMVNLWEQYKLKIVANCFLNFAASVDIDVDLNN